MIVSRMYTDYLKEIKLTIPDKFIDVKTGESYDISKTVHDEIEYHATNNTLIHLVFSALQSYLQPHSDSNVNLNKIMFELLELKKLLQQGTLIKADSNLVQKSSQNNNHMNKLNLDEIADVLDAYGG